MFAILLSLSIISVLWDLFKDLVDVRALRCLPILLGNFTPDDEGFLSSWVKSCPNALSGLVHFAV